MSLFLSLKYLWTNISELFSSSSSSSIFFQCRIDSEVISDDSAIRQCYYVCSSLCF